MAIPYHTHNFQIQTADAEETAAGARDDLPVTPKSMKPITDKAGSALQPETGVYGIAARADAPGRLVPAPVMRISVTHAGMALDYVRDAAGTALETADGVKWSPAGVPTPEHWGAIGDGVTDDTTALQAAIDSGSVVTLRGRVYRHTGLHVTPASRNAGFITAASPSRYPYASETAEAILLYDGVSGDDRACLAASAEDIGVEPASTFDKTIFGFRLHGVTLDANGKAGFGLYCARVQDIDFDRIKCRGATVAGCSINGTYSGVIRNPQCYLNPGRGFEIGAADTRWSWTVNDKVNALYIYGLYADQNGSGAQFRENDAALRQLNCGVFLSPHRGVSIFGITSEHNFGANVVINPTSSANLISGLYTELGCKYAPGGAGTDAISLGYATKQWGLIFVGTAAAQNFVVDTYSSASDYIWLTGTSPTSSRRESALELRNVALAPGMTAEWGAYRLVNCARELMQNITGTQPNGAYTVMGGLQLKEGGSVLSAYEEGDFTPTLRGGATAGTGWTYSAASLGSYTRIGRAVTVTGRIVLTAKSLDATGQIQIGGLPFAVGSGNKFQGAASVRASNLSTNVVGVTGGVSNGGSVIILWKRDAASASDSSLTLADLSDTTVMDFTATYQTT